MDSRQSTKQGDPVVGKDEMLESHQPMQASDFPDLVTCKIEDPEVFEVRNSLHSCDVVGRQVECDKKAQHLQALDPFDLVVMQIQRLEVDKFGETHDRIRGL